MRKPLVTVAIKAFLLKGSNLKQNLAQRWTVICPNCLGREQERERCTSNSNNTCDNYDNNLNDMNIIIHILLFIYYN